MTLTRPRLWWAACLLAALGLTALYAEPLATRFLNDDYLFLEQARTLSLGESLAQLGPLKNYYRPLSRQIYFELLAPIAGGHPLVFHAVNFAAFLAALALLADLLRVFLPIPGVLAGCLYFATLPLQRVNLTWVSCSQDLLALVATLGAVALFRRGRTGLAALAYLAALASKEVALALPVALAAWSAWVDRRPLREALGRTLPFAAIALVWAGIGRTMAAAHEAPSFLRFAPENFCAAYVHMIQSLLGLEQIEGFSSSLREHGPALLPIALLAPLAWWCRPESPSGKTASSSVAGADDRPSPVVPSSSSRRPTTGLVAFACAWLAAFGFVIGPVASTWSGYYYTLAGVGGALLVGRALRRCDAWGFLPLVALSLWWHAGTSGVRSFAVLDRPWGWTSHLTHFYFRRAASITESLSRQVRELEPTPPRETRFFFATLPPLAGFQMGNGALMRDLYRDPSLESYFYSQFSETTAADRPCRFAYWDGAALRTLYPEGRDRFFHVGSDLLLLDRPRGASHAFRRGLAEGGDAMDHLYWLGWAELWSGNRALAEEVWKRFGAVDDSLFSRAHLRAAHNALVDGDTLSARRNLIRAIEFGIGHPEAHAVLGELLAVERPKYAALELKVATWLKPDDWMARRTLALGLVEARLDDAARRELLALEALYPEWRSDSTVSRAWRALEARREPGGAVVKF